MQAALDIVHADGRQERVLMHRGRVVVGSGSDADVQLLLPGIRSQHLCFTARQQRCWVATAANANVMPTHDGQQFGQNYLLWGDSCEFAGLRLTPRLISAAKKPHNRTLLWGSGGLVLTLVVWLMSASTFSSEVAALPPSPDLFDAPPRCVEVADAAHDRAAYELQAARAHEERYAFAASDGIRAVQAYAMAEACFQRATPNSAATSSSAATPGSVAAQIAAARLSRLSLAQRIEEDFVNARLRFERNFAEARHAAALQDCQLLLELTQHRAGPFREKMQNTYESLMNGLQP